MLCYEVIIVSLLGKRLLCYTFVLWFSVNKSNNMGISSGRVSTCHTDTSEIRYIHILLLKASKYFKKRQVVGRVLP